MTPSANHAAIAERRTPTSVMPTTASNPPPPTELPAPSGPRPMVKVGEASFEVEVAETPESRAQGLSGRDPLADGSGMLFVFKNEGVRTFWMKEMNFPLDMVWIDAACTLVDISRDVPQPDPNQTLADLPTYGPAIPVLYVLEINAGVSDSVGLGAGDSVSFTGALEGRYGC